MKKNKGISLIVLVITIIVIIILATSIIVSLINNNPISEANKARYENDRDNMQSVFTNTVSKIMVKNQATVNITAGQINTEISGLNETTGEVIYTVTNAVNRNNENGKIVFDKGENTDTIYYTGKKLPIYSSGDTKWYVDSDGIISLEVAGVKYGNGETTLKAGLYDENDELLISWDKLIEDDILIINNDVLITNFDDSKEIPINYSSETLKGKLIIDSSVKELGNKAFTNCEYLTDVIIPNSVTNIGEYAFDNCISLKNINIPDSVTSINSAAFQYCEALDTIEIPNNITTISMDMFYACTSLKKIVLPESITNIDNNAFSFCIALETFIVPSSVTKIASHAFYCCTNLTSLTIYNNLSSIGSMAIGECENFKTINYSGTKDEWNSIQFYAYWNYWCEEITVHCTDGDIIIPADN